MNETTKMVAHSLLLVAAWVFLTLLPCCAILWCLTLLTPTQVFVAIGPALAGCVYLIYLTCLVMGRVDRMWREWE